MSAIILVWALVMILFVIFYFVIEFAKWRCSQVDDIQGEDPQKKDHQNP